MIRRAREGDLDAVMEIEELGFPNPRSMPSFKFRLDREGFFVYVDEGEVVGYVVVAVEDAPWWMEALRGENEGHVLDLAVHPRHRRTGIGEALMRKGLRFLVERGVPAVKLEVRVDNETAMGLYEKLGFERVRVLRSYYSDGDDAWLMRRRLN